MTSPATVATNLAGFVEAPRMTSTPFRLDRDGHPYLPVGDGGVVCGVHLGDSVFATDTDHAAPGACLTHPDADTLHALTTYACLGNPVEIRSGRARGARGAVLGKRGEQGRVIACFADEVLADLAPGDAVAIRGHGQGATMPTFDGGAGEAVHLMNTSPPALSLLPIEPARDHVIVAVRAVVPSLIAGNGIGRPAHQWDIDLQIHEASPGSHHVQDLRLGDLLAVSDLDVRHNAGHRRGWTTIGIVVHGASPQPGHGPGLMPILCGPAPCFVVNQDRQSHRGITLENLLNHSDTG